LKLQANDVYSITMSTQAFLLLCRLFDGCYDDLKQQPIREELVEPIAGQLLSGVAFLHEQKEPPKQIRISLSFEQMFFLRKLLVEMLSRMQKENGQEKTRSWLKEALVALEQAGL
jgi:hypothetical protein